ncbi:MAG TPA: hypothetical protein PKC76_08010 [Saprospiraceae bacterium]|nr:hypothetical protein [Saprospiraceae bacterium]HMP24059.1 hypothetical protein [Saprospiraceae bacterium]
MKMHHFLLLFITVITCYQCGKKETPADNANDSGFTFWQEDEADDAVANLAPEEAVKKALQQLEKGEPDAKPAADHKQLQALLPERLVGIPRSSIEGQKSGLQGLSIATAKAEYEMGDKRLSVALVDAGSSSLTLAGLAMWASMEFERESNGSYERTTVIDGHKAFEQYDNNTQSGQVNVLVDNRFVLSIEGENVSEKDLRQALKGINLRKLAGL